MKKIIFILFLVSSVFGQWTHWSIFHNWKLQNRYGKELVSNLTTWNNGSSNPYETFTTSGIDITDAVNSSGSGRAWTNQGLSVITGEIYKVEFDLDLISGDTPQLKFKDGEYGIDASDAYNTVDGHNRIYIKIITDDTDTGIFFNNATNSEWSMSNLSIKKKI